MKKTKIILTCKYFKEHVLQIKYQLCCQSRKKVCTQRTKMRFPEVTELFHGVAKDASVFFYMEQEYYYGYSFILFHENIN